jgi:hypothetical protein
MKRSRAVSAQNSKGVEFLFKKNKVTWIRGEGVLEQGRKVTVTGADGKKETHEAKKAVVIATGSRVRGLPQAGLELDRNVVLSSDDVLVAEKAPRAYHRQTGAVGDRHAVQRHQGHGGSRADHPRRITTAAPNPARLIDILVRRSPAPVTAGAMTEAGGTATLGSLRWSRRRAQCR